MGGILDLPLRDVYSVRTISSLDDNVDVEENPTAYSVSADLLGLGEEDVKLEVQHGVLSISAEKKVETQTEGKDGHPTVTSSRTTRRSFHRYLKLPENVHEKGISAKIEKGILALSLPKRREVPPRRIAITGASPKRHRVS